jgi:hypothetical protein
MHASFYLITLLCFLCAAFRSLHCFEAPRYPPLTTPTLQLTHAVPFSPVHARGLSMVLLFFPSSVSPQNVRVDQSFRDADLCSYVSETEVALSPTVWWLTGATSPITLERNFVYEVLRCSLAASAQRLQEISCASPPMLRSL